MAQNRIAAQVRIAVIFLAEAIALPQSVWAQVPSISGTVPQATKPGETTTVKIQGGNLAGVTEIWKSFPGEAVLAPDVPNNGKNAGELVYRIQTPADVPVGVHGIRVATPGGTSNLFLFVIDELTSVPQAKPNNSPATAQALTLPCAVDGNVDSLVRNYYKVSVQAGQHLSFEVLARRIGSALDPMIRILDLRGRELAYSDDAPGLGSDSQLRYTFKNAGEYLVEVRDIRFQGGGNFRYRLRIGDYPCVTVPYPMAVKRGTPATIAFAGAQAQNTQPVTVNAPADPTTNWMNVGAKEVGGQISGFTSLSVSSEDEAIEQEPNDEPAMATRVPLGASLNGRFEKPGDIDRFVMTAKMGQRFTFSGITRQQGSPTDLFMRLLKADGAQVAAAEDTGTGEGVIDFTFPADGDYTLIVEDLHRRGGPEFAYRIAVAPFKPSFDIAASLDTVNVLQEGVATVTVTSVRKGYNGPIDLGLLNAPAGIAVTPTSIAAGQNTVVLTIQNTGHAPDGKIYDSVRIVGKAKIDNNDYQTIATLSGAQQKALNGIPLPPRILSETFAIGIGPQPFYVLRSEPAQLVFGKNLSATVKLKALRAADFPEAITIAVDPPQNGLPGGVTAAVKPIDKDKSEVEITLSANAQAPLGDFNIVLAGTGKKGNDTVVQAAPSIRLSLKAPFTLKTDLGPAKVARGATLKGKVTAERNPAYSGPIVLTFANLPKGLTAEAVTIPADKNEAEVTLTAAADAQVGAVNNLNVKGEGEANKAKVTESSPNINFTVE